jgi:hypothetical protein
MTNKKTDEILEKFRELEKNEIKKWIDKVCELKMLIKSNKKNKDVKS